MMPDILTIMCHASLYTNIKVGNHTSELLPPDFARPKSQLTFKFLLQCYNFCSMECFYWYLYSVGGGAGLGSL